MNHGEQRCDLVQGQDLGAMHLTECYLATKAYLSCGVETHTHIKS